MTTGSQSVDRAIALFEAIVLDDGRTPATEIAATFGLKPSSARRLLAALKRQGLIRSVAHGRYAGGQRLSVLTVAGNPYRSLIEGARPLLKRIAERTGWAAHLGILDQDMVTYLVKEGGDSLFTREGAQLEAYSTGIGKVLLAHLPESSLQKYLSGHFVRMTSKTIVNVELLESEIRLTQERGFGIDNCEMSEELVCVAVPVLTDGTCIAALSLSGNVHHFPLAQAQRIAFQLQKLAASTADRVSIYG